MISLLIHFAGLVCLMTAGHTEYKAKHYEGVIPHTAEGRLRAQSNLAMLAWIGFGFSASYWTEWYWALLCLCLSAVLPGVYSTWLIRKNYVAQATKLGLLAGIVLCTVALII